MFAYSHTHKVMNFCVPIQDKSFWIYDVCKFLKRFTHSCPQRPKSGRGTLSDRVQETRRNKFHSVIESLNKATPRTLDYDLKSGCFFVWRLRALPLSVSWIIPQNSDGPTLSRHVHVYTMELFIFRHKSCLSLQIMLQQVSLDTALECSSKYRSSTTRSQEFRIPGGDNCFLWSLQFPFV